MYKFWKLGLLTIICSALLGVAPRGVNAAPEPELDVPALVTNSSVIVVGQVTQVTTAGATTVTVNGQSLTAKRVNLTISVTRVMKGTVGATITNQVLIPSQGVGYPGVGTSTFGLWFCQGPSQPYTPTDPFHPFLSASSRTPITQSNPLDKAAGEIGNVLGGSDKSVEEQAQAVVILQNILRKTSSAPAVTALQTTVQDVNSLVRYDAAAVLINRNDVTTLNSIADALMQSSGISTETLNGLSSALQDGITDPTALDTLTRLVSAPSVEIRRGAAGALRNLKIAAIVQPLSLALDDSDQEVRYQAIMGLAEYGNDPNDDDFTPAFEDFQANEQEYLDYWKTWAASH